MPQILRGRRYGAVKRTSATGTKLDASAASATWTRSSYDPSWMTASTDGTSRSVSALTRTTPRSGSTRTGTSAPESRMVASRMVGSCGSCDGTCEVGRGSVGAHEAAVDADLLTGEVAGLVGGEEGDDRAELGGRAVPAGGDRG